MITYPDYQPPEGGSFLKLKEHLANDGDTIRLKCVNGVIKPASESTFGCTQLEMTVLMNDSNDAKELVFSCDAPDEKNEFQGSQVYRGIKDNNIQAGDVFTITHGGRMNNKYKTVIYEVAKDQPAVQTNIDLPPKGNDGTTAY